MWKIGIDIGSTYTKYCIQDHTGEIIELLSEKTPVRQREYFRQKADELSHKYPGASIVSCGYGRKNICSLKAISELTALAAGSFRMDQGIRTVLDIGGQDTKVIVHEDGKLKEFFVNDKCAAGSGMFLSNTCKLLEYPFKKIDLSVQQKPRHPLSSVCAVFAQSEITELIANNVSEDEIICSVLWHILMQARALLGKVRCDELLLSGGLTAIPGIDSYASSAFGVKCVTIPNGGYLSAIGCACLAGTI